MSDHLDHEESASGKIDPRVDIADLYVFPSPTHRAASRY